MGRRLSPALKARFARVKLLLCDVDGILTDASVFIGGREEIKRFNIQDGLGLILLQRAGVKVGWISNRPSRATLLRAEDLKIDFLHQGKGSKVVAIERILEKAGASWADVCYAGDDIVDLPALMRAGLAVAVPNANLDAKRAAHYITQARGGEGAVREIVELILKAKNRWKQIIQEYVRET
jgi:3-deoxy-D-manno-octulosonate 8-phosphate phosphatase (KDO 8-P phosphatase)